MFTQVKCILLLHIIHRYIHALSKYSDENKGGQVCFTHGFSWPCKHWKTSEEPLGSFNKMAWTLLNVSFVWTLVLSCVVVVTGVVTCLGAWGACGCLFSNWIPVATARPHCPPTYLPAYLPMPLNFIVLVTFSTILVLVLHTHTEITRLLQPYEQMIVTSLKHHGFATFSTLYIKFTLTLQVNATFTCGMLFYYLTTLSQSSCKVVSTLHRMPQL